MRTLGATLCVIAAFVYFHTPDGGMIAIKPGDGQIIIRPSPPGYLGKTMIETGAGTAVVIETPCVVARALEQACPPHEALPF